MPRYEMDVNGWWTQVQKGVQKGGQASKGGKTGKGGQGGGQGGKSGKYGQAWGGKAGHAGKEGQRKGKSKGKGKAREPDAPPRGSYLSCDGECNGWAYADVAGATCRLCEKQWNWKAFWDQLAGKAGGEPQNLQGTRNMETDAEAAPGREGPQEGTASTVVEQEVAPAVAPAELPDTPSLAHAKAMAKLKDCWKTVEKYDVQLKHESGQLVQMGGSLDAKIQAVKDQMQKMEEQATTITKVEAERTIAFKSYTQKDEERAKIWSSCAASISTKVAVAFPALSRQAAAYVSPATLEMLGNLPVQAVPTPVAAGPTPVPNAFGTPAAPSAIDFVVHAIEAQDREMDEAARDYDWEGQDGEDCSSEEDETKEDAPIRYMDEEYFREAMVSWAFYAQQDQEPPEDLMQWFNVWGTDSTTIDAVGNLLREGRSHFLEARKIAVKDMEHTAALDNAGQHELAKSVQAQSDLYSQERKEAIWFKLDEHLKSGLAVLWAKRNSDLEAGIGKAPEKMAYAIEIPPHAKKGKAKGGKNVGGKGNGGKNGAATTKPKKVKKAKEKAAAEVCKTGGLQPANDGADAALEESAKERTADASAGSAAVGTTA